MKVACINRPQLLEQVRIWVSEPTEAVHTLSYVNAHCLNIAITNPDYAHHLNTFSCVYADGMGAVWAGKWLHGCTLHKMTGADWIHDLCRMAEHHRWRIYLLAGAEGIVQQARANLTAQYPGLQIVGARSGFFTTTEEKTIVAEISSLRPDILLVGLGVPLQEAWITRWKNELPVRICWAVGALFDYVAGLEPRAPRWMRAVPLEWLWRLLVDPAGKWQRYLIGMPLFAFRVMRDKISHR